MNGTQTLGRALDILFVLAESETTLTVSELSSKVSIPESTAYRLLQTLEQNGIVERKGKGQIGLGLRILDLARSLHQQIDRELFVIARPIMEQLTEKINETSILMVRTGLNAICIQNVESRRLIRLAIDNGRTLPLHQGASGKTILAFESDKVKQQVIKLIDDEEKKEKLIRDLEQILRQGYCITVGEVDEDVCGIAFPIYDNFQRVVASLSLAGPADRFRDDAIEQMIKEAKLAAEQINTKLGQVSQLTNL